VAPLKKKVGHHCPKPKLEVAYTNDKENAILLWYTKDSSIKRDAMTSILALGYRLDDWGSRVRLPAGAGNFSLHHSVQNGSGVHPASYPMDTRGSFLRGKAAGS
jgi:hypothetical protein